MRNWCSADANFVTGPYRTGPSLTINPTGNMMVIGCVDPRVDPSHVLGIRHGEAAVIRNVGGRVTPATLRTMTMLRKVGEANPDGKASGPWNLVILHHTDCGMTDLAPFEDLLAEYFEISRGELAAKSVSDPYGSVHVDVGVVRQEDPQARLPRLRTRVRRGRRNRRSTSSAPPEPHKDRTTRTGTPGRHRHDRTVMCDTTHASVHDAALSAPRPYSAAPWTRSPSSPLTRSVSRS